MIDWEDIPPLPIPIYYHQLYLDHPYLESLLQSTITSASLPSFHLISPCLARLIFLGPPLAPLADRLTNRQNSHPNDPRSGICKTQESTQSR